MEDLVPRLVRAIVAGIIAGIVTAILIFIVSALLPLVRLDASLWGTIVGLLVALYTFFNGQSRL